MTVASASGKTILLGEHAVVYGRPAIAVPVSDVRATVEVVSLSATDGVQIVAKDLNESYHLDGEYEADTARALQVTVRNTLQHLGITSTEQGLRIIIRSQIPIARGMGSGTAVATALVRALAQHFGHQLISQAVSDLVYQTEIIFHGTPSGVDNTVVAFEKPVYFRKGHPIEVFEVGESFTILIADTGVPSKTRVSVDEVRLNWLADPQRYEAFFDEIGAYVDKAREAIAAGELPQIGVLMNQNQILLRELGVSSPKLDQLVAAALDAGAMGAKLSGGGRGGSMIALVDGRTREDVISALLLTDARQVIPTTVR